MNKLTCFLLALLGLTATAWAQSPSPEHSFDEMRRMLQEHNARIQRDLDYQPAPFRPTHPDSPTDPGQRPPSISENYQRMLLQQYLDQQRMQQIQRCTYAPRSPGC